jgi:glycosyltransferase involved in cell wall biosynthesis
MPKVSVVIATRNRAKLLEEALRSVFSQTFQDFEVVIVDDASTDGSKDHVYSLFSNEAGRIRYLTNEQQKERCYTRNRGILASSGEYVALLDDDDIWLPHHLESLIGFLEENPDVGMAFSNYIHYSIDGFNEKAWSDDVLKDKDSAFEYRELNMIGLFGNLTSCIFRRKIIDEIGGFREDLVFQEDWEFFVRTVMNYRVGYLNRITCLWRKLNRAARYDVFSEEYGNRAENALKAILDDSKKYNVPLPDRILAREFIEVATRFIPSNFSKARTYLLKGLRRDPKKLLYPENLLLTLKLLMGKKLYLMLLKLKKKI